MWGITLIASEKQSLNLNTQLWITNDLNSNPLAAWMLLAEGIHQHCCCVNAVWSNTLFGLHHQLKQRSSKWLWRMAMDNCWILTPYQSAPRTGHPAEHFVWHLFELRLHKDRHRNILPPQDFITFCKTFQAILFCDILFILLDQDVFQVLAL